MRGRKGESKLLRRGGKGDVLRSDNGKRESDGINERIVMEMDVLISDFGNRIGFIGFENKIELLGIRGKKRKLSSRGG